MFGSVVETASHKAPQGVKLCNKALIHNPTPTITVTGNLATDAFSRVKERFHRFGHTPSEEMQNALRAVLETFEHMVDGTCPESIFLSSLDPGVGKTQTVISFIEALRASPILLHKHVSMMICVSRLEEIQNIVQSLGLEQDEFGVLTSDDSLNSLGSVDRNQARFLFTTHKMVERRSEGRDFDDIQEFHYCGDRRQVLVWDEAMLPGSTLTINRDDIAELIKPLRKANPVLGAELDNLCQSLYDEENGHRQQIPDIVGIFGSPSQEVKKLIPNLSPDQEAAIEALWRLSGRWVTVRNDGATGNTVLDYEETLPKGIAPVLILDASGRVRNTYRLWESERGGVVRLPSATKDYSNLDIHVWPTGGGKQSFRRKAPTLLSGIANTINERPDEEWLVVHHKAEPGFDVVKDLKKMLIEPRNVHFLNWGSHDATNRFAHIENVILAGTLFFPASYHESLGRASAGHPSNEGDFPEAWSEEIEEGELMHLVLQALCRGAVRRCLGDRCAPCNAYVIASKRSGLRELLGEIFPNCSISDWQPVRIRPSGRVKDALDVITRFLENNPEGFITIQEVHTALGMNDASNFRRNVRQHSVFCHELAHRGIEEVRLGRELGFSLADADLP